LLRAAKSKPGFPPRFVTGVTARGQITFVLIQMEAQFFF
jgi:hypothetical protein